MDKNVGEKILGIDKERWNQMTIDEKRKAAIEWAPIKKPWWDLIFSFFIFVGWLLCWVILIGSIPFAVFGLIRLIFNF